MGRQSARTTARMATPGDYSRTTSPVPGPTAGAKDALGGFSDDNQRLCFALALWNEPGPDPKGAAPSVSRTAKGTTARTFKRYYFYLDSTPTHWYDLPLEYPQREFPVSRSRRDDGRRTGQDLEYELIDTGIFDDDRYFDVFLEYAKAGPEDILVRVSVHNRGPEAARLHVLPTLWFRNTVVVGGRGRDSGPLRDRRGGGGFPSRAGRLHALVRRCPRAAVHRERKQRPNGSGASRTRRRTSRTRSTAVISAAIATR